MIIHAIFGLRSHPANQANFAIATDALMNLSGCKREQIMVLYFEPASPNIKLEMVAV
ncbi:MAG: hypothetical protein WBA89_09365 [Microcoleus sp.]|uniref:hypothetical protein n=1 Tax=Microcoleus sp. TaxID=44472 RepID=UPI003C77F0C9